MAQAETVAIPKRLPLVIEPENRGDSTDKDAKLVNGFVETHKGLLGNETWIYKRPGTLENATYSETGVGRGLFNWKGNIYAAFGTSLFRNGTSIGTIDATNGVYRFDQTLGATPYLIAGNGVRAYTWDATTFAQITDPDFPAAFVKGWAYLDGTTYVMTALAEIQGSDLNAPPLWDPLNVVIAQIEPDGGVATAKQLVYVVALKQWSTEIYYDAANATGSPLGTVQGAKLNYGCLTADSVQQIDGSLIWVSATKTNSGPGPAQVVILDNLKLDVVSTKAVERLLSVVDFSQAVYSWAFKDRGHTFYVLTCVSINMTLVFDLRERMWSQWTDSSGNYLPIVAACSDASQNTLVQHATNGKVYTMNDVYTNDDGSAIQVDLYPPQFDGGTNRSKTLEQLEFISDQVAGSYLLVRNNDNDYEAGSWTNFRRVSLENKRAFLTNCGSFVHRAYHFRHQANTKLRLQAVEMQIDLGTL